MKKARALFDVFTTPSLYTAMSGIIVTQTMLSTDEHIKGDLVAD